MSDLSLATIEAADVTPDVVRRLVPSAHVVEVHDAGILVGGFLSRQELEHYRHLVNREVEVFRTGKLPNDIVAALEDSLGRYGQGVE